MGLQETLMVRAGRFVDPGERVEMVAMVRTGPNPFLSGLFGIGFILGWVKYRHLVVTNRSIHILTAGGLNGTEPKEPLARVPRPTSFGPTSGLWARVDLAGEPVWVHRRFHPVLAHANTPPT